MINYHSFWINFDSLSEHGPEYLEINELLELISRQLSDQGSFIQIFGDFPKFYNPIHTLQTYQKYFSMTEIINNGNLIKGIRNSQKRPLVSNLSFEEQLKLAYESSLRDNQMNTGGFSENLPSEEEQLNLAKALSMAQSNKFEVPDQEDKNNIELELALKLSVEENKHLIEKYVVARVVRDNGRVSLENIKENECFSEIENRLKEKLGFTDLEIYLKKNDFDFFPQKNLIFSQEVDIKHPIILYAKCKI